MYQRALDHFNTIASIEPRYRSINRNIGLTLVFLDRDDDAMGRFIRAWDIEAPQDEEIRFLLLVDFVGILAKTGRLREATEAFEEAASMAKLPMQYFWTANAASDIDMHPEACELFARALSVEMRKPLGEQRATDFIRAAPERLMGCLRYAGADIVMRSVELVEANEHELLECRAILSKIQVDGASPSPEYMEDAQAVYEAMAPFRTRASRVAFGGDGDGQV
jgi:hypothetical protein